MRTPHDIVIRPVVSEHSMEQFADRKYTFAVALDANKIEIKKAIEEIFGVKVEKVTTMRVLGKVKRMGMHSGKRPDWKKAIVKLTPDSKTIEFFEGMV
ncbi:MAG: 50S ribosomal protein L23 [Firmicutes bacterium]|nr:50S ribosomal protein L23 [Bacillota bacterium]